HTKFTSGRHREELFERCRLQIVVRVTVSEGKRPNTFRVLNREDLRDSGCAVVRHEVYLSNVQGIEKFFEHSRLRIVRDFLISRNFSCALSKQIERDASPQAAQLR